MHLLHRKTLEDSARYIEYSKTSSTARLVLNDLWSDILNNVLTKKKTWNPVMCGMVGGRG
jgi:hypothetical protein